MNTINDHESLAEVFREITLSLVGLFQIYDVESDLSEATAKVLGRLFRQRVRTNPIAVDNDCHNCLHALVDEMQSVVKRDIHNRVNQ